MSNNFKKLNKKYFLAIFLLFLFFSFVLGVSMVQAQAANTILNITGGISDSIMKVLGWIFYIIAAIIGLILTLLIQILVDVAGFNNIINTFAVKTGWVIVRDLCNMFFILILLVIAFATILRIESYSAKRLLPKLLIMAVLINFSKTIFGLIIDFSQVIMLTFVNGFGQYGANNLVGLFQIEKYLMFGNTSQGIMGKGKIGTWETTGAVLAGFFAIIITTITVAVLLAVLVFRIIMLWVYTILSPLVFFGAAFPGGQKYTSRIWEDFIKQVLVGPLLAFFIWLALLTASQSTQELKAPDFSGSASKAEIGGQKLCGTSNSLFCSNEFTTYIITIALLIGGLMVTQSMGGVAGSMAGKGLSWARRAPMLTGAGALGLAGWGARKLYARTGVEVRPTKWIAGLRETLKERKKDEEIEGESKAGAALREGKLWGAFGASRDFTDAAARGFLWRKAWQPGGVAQQTWKVGRIRKQINKLEGERSNKETTKERKIEINKEIGSKYKELEKYKTPYTFHADAKRMANIQEEMKKFYDNDNEDDLYATFQDAFRNKDAKRSAAVVLHAARVSHDNEMIEKSVALEDVVDEKGNIVTKKGDFLKADQSGQTAFFKQYFVKGLGMAEQEAYSIMTHFGTIAKKVGHFNLSESVGVKNNLLVPRSPSEQMKRATGEIMKTDAEGSLRRLNRLGMGGEMQYIDKRGNIQRVMLVNEMTANNFSKMAPTWDLEVNDRRRLNPNNAENLYKNFLKSHTGEVPGLQTLVDVAKDLEGLDFIDKKGNKKSHEQLAWETLRFGKPKYETARRSELISLIRQADGEKKKALGEQLKEEEKIWKDVDEEINRNLERFGVKSPTEASPAAPSSTSST